MEYPSGLELAAAARPTAPPAPDLVAITTGCWRIFSIVTASGRAVRSTKPPGGHGMIMVIGRLGYCSCANAAAANANSEAVNHGFAIMVASSVKKSLTNIRFAECTRLLQPPQIRVADRKHLLQYGDGVLAQQRWREMGPGIIL